MPTETSFTNETEASLEGRSFQPNNDQDLVHLVNLAFDYRGDITLALRDGTQVQGYLFNRDPRARTIDMMLKSETAPRQFEYGQVTGIAFTGEDPARGRSWEEWHSKHASERKAEDEKNRLAAIERGEL